MAGSKRMGAAEWGYLLALAGAWGGIFLFNRYVLAGFPPLTAVFLRVGIAAPILVALVYLRGERLPRSPALWAAFAVMGFLNNALPFTLFVWAQQTIASGLASIINATTPFFAVLLAHVMTADERMSGAKIAGVLLGTVGVVAVIGPETLSGFGRDAIAETVLLLAPLSYACAGIWGRRFRALTPAVAAAGMVVSSSVLMLPVALWYDRPWTLSPSALSWAAVAAQAAIGTALAYWLYFRILRTAGATNLLLVTFLMPPAALALGAIFAGEHFAWTAFAGLALIFAGLATIDGRLLTRFRKREPIHA